MNVEKIKYSKCPYCKKYGISASRGVGYKSNHAETCKYCKKSFKVNWAFSFVAEFAILFVGLLIYYLINKFIIPVSIWIPIITIIAVYESTLRFYPMEEETPSYICSCCTLKTLFLNPDFSKEICPVCRWQNDTSLNGSRTIISDKNGISLDEAKDNFAKIGVSNPKYVK